jgi:hypothetical protein
MSPSFTLIFCLTRLPSLSLRQFQDYWRTNHAPLVAKHAGALRITSYIQSHTLDDAALEGVATVRNAPARFDGVARLSWASFDELRLVLTEKDSRKAAMELLEDERKFIDLAKSPIFFARDTVIVGAGQ